MSVFVKRNIGNVWKNVEVSDAEVAAIEKSNFKSNVRLAASVLQYLPKLLKKEMVALNSGTPDFEVSADIVKSLIPVFVEQMTTPLHFAIETWVDTQLTQDHAKL